MSLCNFIEANDVDIDDIVFSCMCFCMIDRYIAFRRHCYWKPVRKGYFSKKIVYQRMSVFKKIYLLQSHSGRVTSN